MAHFQMFLIKVLEIGVVAMYRMSPDPTEYPLADPVLV